MCISTGRGSGRHLDHLATGRGTVELLLAHFAERNHSRHECKERMVLAGTYIFAGKDLSTALAHENTPGLGGLPGIELGTQVLWIGIA